VRTASILIIINVCFAGKLRWNTKIIEHQIEIIQVWKYFCSKISWFAKERILSFRICHASHFACKNTFTRLQYIREMGAIQLILLNRFTIYNDLKCHYNWWYKWEERCIGLIHFKTKCFRYLSLKGKAPK